MTDAEINEILQESANTLNVDMPVTEEVPDKIPVNSDSFLVSETTSRFSGAEWFDTIRNQKILLAGLGGIGSWVGMLLGRLQISTLYMYDDDVVDASNMSGQFYGRADIGSKKANALAAKLRAFSDFGNTVSYVEKYGQSSPTRDIMICGFDNMRSRSLFFGKWLTHVNSLPIEERDKCLFIDGRLAAEEFQIYCIQGNDNYNISRYNDSCLFNDLNADRTICSYKQTSFCANMIASVMVNLFVNFVANLVDPVIKRDLPFLTVYNGELMYFKTEA